MGAPNIWTREITALFNETQTKFSNSEELVLECNVSDTKKHKTGHRIKLCEVI